MTRPEDSKPPGGVPREAEAAGRPVTRRARIVLGCLDVLTALAVLGFSSTLFSRSGLTPALFVAWGVALLASGIGLLGGWSWGRTAARVTAVGQLLLLFGIACGLLLTVASLWGMYGQVGTGVSIAVLAVLALLFEVMGALPVFKLRAVGLFEKAPPWWSRVWPAVLLVLALVPLLGGAAAYHHSAYPSWEPLEYEEKERIARDAMAQLMGTPPSPAPTAAAPGTQASTYAFRVFAGGRVKRRFVVRGTPDEAAMAAQKELAGMRLKPSWRPAVVVDRVVAEAPIPTTNPVLTALSVVPGLDGVAGRVGDLEVLLLPQELVELRMLREETPVFFMPDVKAGVRLESVRARICWIYKLGDECRVEALRRVRTESWLYREGKLTPLYRGRPPIEAEVTRQDARRGAALGGDYVLRALGSDGRFVYELNPIDGKKETKRYSIPRHAGTSWFLVMLGDRTGDPKYTAGAIKALDWLDKRLGECGGDRRCVREGRIATLGSQALPLIAVADHLRKGGADRFRPTALALGEMVLAMQKEDGDFYFEWDTMKAGPRASSRHFYAAGQAAMALAIMADLTKDERYVEAADRAMDFISGPYWDFYGGEFFFFEEHWTCLAAQEVFALTHKREHAEICFDVGRFHRYTQFKEWETVYDDYVGGVGFGPFFPPHSGPASSRTESMVAAWRLAEQVGEDDREFKEGIAEAIRFLLHNQYDEVDNYRFRHAQDGVGGLPWSSHDPMVRIDGVQHAATAMILGAEALPE